MQIERSTGEMPYGTVIVPIEGEESTRLPGRGGGDLAGRIDEYRSDIVIAGEVIRRGRTDDAGSGYDDGPFFLFGGSCFFRRDVGRGGRRGHGSDYY